MGGPAAWYRTGGKRNPAGHTGSSGSQIRVRICCPVVGSMVMPLPPALAPQGACERDGQDPYSTDGGQPAGYVLCGGGIAGRVGQRRGRVHFIGLPLKIRSGAGSPVRVVAILER
jgi:hypothetical protein